MHSDAYIDGVRAALRQHGLGSRDLEKIASSSQDRALHALCAAVHRAELRETFVKSAGLGDIIKRLGRRAPMLGLGGLGGLGGASWAAADSDDVLTNDARRWLGMDTVSNLEAAIGEGAGSVTPPLQRLIGNTAHIGDLPTLVRDVVAAIRYGSSDTPANDMWRDLTEI